MAIPYTKKQFIQRIVKHLNDNYKGADWKITDNEILLHIDTSIPFVLKSQMYENAKMTGLFEVPDAYLATYELDIAEQKSSTQEWYVTLPQTPIELPTGYDITNVFLTDTESKRSLNGLPLKNKRASFRNLMPKPSGFTYRVEGDTMYLQANDGNSLYGFTLNVQMPISRTTDVDDVMNLPDGAIDALFTKTIATILQRYNIPQDTVLDNLPAGNKTS